MTYIYSSYLGIVGNGLSAVHLRKRIETPSARVGTAPEFFRDGSQCIEQFFVIGFRPAEVRGAELISIVSDRSPSPIRELLLPSGPALRE